MYYGITIGPIFATITKARKFKELWLSSYMFSFVTQKIAQQLYNNKATIFLPFVDQYSFELSPIGSFPDRLIFQAELSLKEVENICQQAKKELIDYLGQDFDFLQNYIYTYIAQLKEPQYPIDELYAILNDLELHQLAQPYQETLYHTLLDKESINKTPLVKKLKLRYDSIKDIAAKDKIEDLALYNYIAIVHADGDNLSKAIKEYGYDKVSKKLHHFTQAIKRDHDLQKYIDLIYLGGDDLFFLAPLKAYGKTIFDILDTIRNYYKEQFDDISTISFGLSITYTKYPLYEALELSRNALFGIAKRGPKNSVGVIFQKHSGQRHSFKLQFDDQKYQQFSKLLTNDIDYPKAIHHKLSKIKPLLKRGDIDAIFENFFDEKEHKEHFDQGLQAIKEYLKLFKQEDIDFDTFFHSLALVKFFTTKEKT